VEKLTFLQTEGEEMKKFILALAVSMAVVMLVAPAFATELWDPHLRGVDEGLAAGALPPPGVYFVHNSYFAMNYFSYDSGGHAVPNVKLFAYVDVPILLWVPGCKFLGADYAMAIAQPFDYTNLRLFFGPGGNVSSAGAQWGTFNTILVPYELSWKLPCDFRIKTGFAVGLDDGTSAPGSSGSSGTAQSANGFYMFTPSIGISWLHAGWNVSAEFLYTMNTKNNATDYQSGDQFAADYTVTYTWGKWTFGLGASQETQVYHDSLHGVTLTDSMAGAWTFGPIVGYNFGPCSLQFVYNFPMYTQNDVGGEWCNLRLVVPLWK
jgi:hypothetical protein